MILSDLIKNIDIIDSNADMETEIAGVAVNSAIAQTGDLFIAVRGFKTDGHKYISDAAGKGAACVVCEEKPDADMPYVLTSDSRKALARISAAWFGYPAEKITLIGVTGTNGKTTVTHLVKHIIEKCSGSKVGLIGTIGNLIGDRELATALTTPDSYELQSILSKMVLEGCKYAVMEVSSHALSLSRVYGLEYEIGIFTNLTPEHLDFHPTMDDYASAKAMLFKMCRNSIINKDDQYAILMAESSAGTVTTYALNNKTADLIGEDVEMNPGKTRFTVQAGDSKMKAAGGNPITGSMNITLHIPGIFSVYNALASIGAGLRLGYDPGDIEKALFSCPGIKGRAEALNAGGEYTVLVDYAHTPDALANIIRTAREVTEGRVVTLFGCGGDRDKTKRPVMGKIAADMSDAVFVTSDNPRTEAPGEIISDILAGIEQQKQKIDTGTLTVIENRKEAICAALDSMKKGDMLIIAGKGHETYQILGTEKVHFDDREVVDEHIRQAREKRRRNHAVVEGLD